MVQITSLETTREQDRIERQHEQQAAAAELAAQRDAYNELQLRIQTAESLAATRAVEADKAVRLCPFRPACCLSQLDFRDLFMPV